MSDQTFDFSTIRVIVGLGNPEPRFDYTRHNIGFYVVDELAKIYFGSFQERKNQAECTVTIQGNPVKLIKPLTYMNNSGDVFPTLSKNGIRPEQILVVHDELEKKFNSLMLRLGGSHRGHNGLRSIMAKIGADFWRLRIGIDRPADKAQVSSYVLGKFTPQEKAHLPEVIDKVMALLGC